MDADTLSRAAGIPLVRAQLWALPLTVAMERFNITTPRREAHFITQTAHESALYRTTREVWGPTDTQKAYEGRTDLGNTRRGDGSLFRGRGLIMVTGRANYAAVGKALGVDLLSNPALLEREDYAALSAAQWWQANGCNQLADANDLLKVSIRVNGKNRNTGLPNGWEDRQLLWKRASQALGVQ